MLKRLGLNADLQAVDWGTLVTRRAAKEPIDKGGWNIFATGWVGADMLDPVEDLPLKTTGATRPGSAGRATKNSKRWAGSGSRRRRSTSVKKTRSGDPGARFRMVLYIPTGMWDQQTAYRKNLRGIIQAPAYLLWNVEKV